MAKMSAEFDEDAHNGVVCIMFTSLLYAPQRSWGGGVYSNRPVRPSVRLSVDGRLGKMISNA